MYKLPHNYNKKLGYYTIGQNEFVSRSRAFVESNRLNDAPHIEFNFNNEFFKRVNWKTEPSESIRELYKQRALQLREKYDYIIISFTGGSDSWTVLDAFLSNGIKVDEIIHYAPLEATKNLTPNNTDFSASNFWSEYHFVAKPQLERIALDHPDIKIVIHDWSVGGEKSKLKEDWQLNRSANLAPHINRRWSLEVKTDSVWKHKNICHIQGLEKPRICIKDNKYCIYFLDFVHLQTVDFEEYCNDHWTTEFFYWAPESEKILRKQAHIIKQFFEQNPGFKPYITWPISNQQHRTFYESLIKGLIYPDYDLSTFQTNKPKTLLMFGLEELIAPVNNTLYKDWEGGVKDLMNEIEDRYKRGDDIVGFVSGFYEI